jgi:hypothetical protein
MGCPTVLRALGTIAVLVFARGEATAAPAAPSANENGALPPLSSDDLSGRASHLFDGIVRDDPKLADDFFFPRDPFVRLKDVADPGRYHQELVRAYHRDVHVLHARRRSWDGARFVAFELTSRPRWVKPGEEWNKIGYYRTFDAKLRYEALGKTHVLEIRTIISWDGQWYVTHLLGTSRPHA